MKLKRLYIKVIHTSAQVPWNSVPFVARIALGQHMFDSLLVVGFYLL